MKNFKLYIIICLLAFFAYGCQKEGYMPPAEGEKVVYTDTARFTLKEGLAKSSATLFYAAWQRSTMDNILKAQTTGKTYFTVMVPSNAAMESAGYTQQKIQSMDVKAIDSLMMFYTLQNRITPEDLMNRTDNYAAKSLLTESKIFLSSGGIRIPYYYRHHLKLQDGKTIVNGKIAGAGKSLGTKDGYIWFLDQPVPRPVKSILKFLQDDGRFTLLLQLLQYTDTQWEQIFQAGAGFPGNRGVFSKRYALDLVADGNGISSVYTTTVWVPTDDAFRAAGFNTLQDLINFNQRKGLPYYGVGPGGTGNDVQGFFGTDYLLNYSLFWGRTLNIAKTNFSSRGEANLPVIYSNIMNNSVIGNLLLVSGSNGSTYEEYYMPFDFSKDAAGNVSLKAKGAEAVSAKIIEADIPTLMGPVNVIDRFIVPKGFTIN